MPYKNLEAKRAYQSAWRLKRRQDWIDANGPCAWCGSNEDLQADHKDHSAKECYLNGIWSLALWNPKRVRELAKCQVLCRQCHEAKSKSEIIGTIHGHCRRGHALAPGNIYQHPKSGSQECLQCKRRRKQEELERLRRLR